MLRARPRLATACMMTILFADNSGGGAWVRSSLEDRGQKGLEKEAGIAFASAHGNEGITRVNGEVVLV